MHGKLTSVKKHSPVAATELNSLNIGTLVDNDKIKTKFALAFRCKLDSNFNFDKLDKNSISAFQKFLDKVSKMTITEVDNLYLKQTDKTDKYDELQVQHYKVNEKFRIHGIWEKSVFYVLRLDSNHEFHK